MRSLRESEIIYRDFWDWPRIFIARHNDHYYLFDCSFNQSQDDYDETYDVFSLPDLPDDALTGSWNHLRAKTISLLGKVPVSEVVFDPSRRRSIDTSIIDYLDTVVVSSQ